MTQQRTFESNFSAKSCHDKKNIRDYKSRNIVPLKKSAAYLHFRPGSRRMAAAILVSCSKIAARDPARQAQAWTASWGGADHSRRQTWPARCQISSSWYACANFSMGFRPLNMKLSPGLSRDERDFFTSFIIVLQ